MSVLDRYFKNINSQRFQNVDTEKSFAILISIQFALQHFFIIASYKFSIKTDEHNGLIT